MRVLNSDDPELNKQVVDYVLEVSAYNLKAYESAKVLNDAMLKNKYKLKVPHISIVSLFSFLLLLPLYAALSFPVWSIVFVIPLLIIFATLSIFYPIWAVRYIHKNIISVSSELAPMLEYVYMAGEVAPYKPKKKSLMFSDLAI